jgi:hypothetical protein
VEIDYLLNNRITNIIKNAKKQIFAAFFCAYTLFWTFSKNNQTQFIEQTHVECISLPSKPFSRHSFAIPLLSYAIPSVSPDIPSLALSNSPLLKSISLLSKRFPLLYKCISLFAKRFSILYKRFSLLAK